MHKLLYYPNFEIQDENFLKFALLYIDEIRPIIPHGLERSLSASMQDILKYTNLINPYSPNYMDVNLASIAAIEHLEKNSSFIQYNTISQRSDYSTRNFILHFDKFIMEFENYCLENGLGERCNEGILLNEQTAFAYMSILAEIISKETETDMITDIAEYSDPILRRSDFTNRKTANRLDKIKKEIQFYVPVDMYKIPLYEFIKLRSDHGFEEARRRFVTELNMVLDSYDENISEIDLNNIMECKQEIYGLLKELFISCAVAAVGVHSFGNMVTAESDSLNFWGNMGSTAISLATLKPHYIAVKEYAKRIAGKRKARKYLARLEQLRTGIL